MNGKQVSVKTKTLMVQGTASDAGKSTVVAGLCRAFNTSGLSVAPFKPQNMALNSAVTPEGGEIGRAQALQAQACNIPPHTDMNPVLIKPSGDTQAQIIIQGKAQHNMSAQNFHRFKPQAMEAVLQSHTRLEQQVELVVVEGAGSPAEINLREGDIANMGFAEAVDCPVVLVADIDKGGVFAQLVGTLELLSPSEQNRIIGFIINKFRGDIKLLENGLTWLEEKTNRPVFGVLPFLHGLYLDSEDAISTQQEVASELHPASEDHTNNAKLKVAIPVLPRISNHTDFDALRLHPHVELSYVDIHAAPPSCDLIILPGSKNVQADLLHLRNNGWEAAINKHLRYGGKVLGICGGFQMLGAHINDPLGIEDTPGSSPGLALIPMSTDLLQNKTLKQVSATLVLPHGQCPISGYEIHNGKSTFNTKVNHCVTFSASREEGYLSPDQQIMGLYIHGLFDEADSCRSLLEWAGLESSVSVDLQANREMQIQRLEAAIKQHINLDQLAQAAGINLPSPSLSDNSSLEKPND